MKAKLFTFVRGLKNGTPPRFQSYLKSLTLLLGLVISMNVWGADKTFTMTEFGGAGSSSSSGDDFSVTVSPITISGTKGNGVSSSTEHFRLYSGGTLVIEGAKITKIVVTCTATGTSNNGPGKLSGDGYTASTGKTGTWENNSGSNKVELSATAQCRFTQIVVTYVESEPYTVKFYKADGSLLSEKKETSAGAGVTTPVAQSTTCLDWTFAGWTTDNITEVTSEKPATLTAANTTFHPSENCNMYPVFTQKTSELVPLTEILDLTKLSTSPYASNDFTIKWGGSFAVGAAAGSCGFKGNSNMTITMPTDAKLTKVSIHNSNAWGSGATVVVYTGTSASGTSCGSMSSTSSGTDQNVSIQTAQQLAGSYYLTNTKSANAWVDKVTLSYMGYGTVYFKNPTCAPTYAITTNSPANGSIKFSTDGTNWSNTIANQPEGADVYFKLVPNAGYELESVNLTSSIGDMSDYWEKVSGEDYYFLMMPAAPVTVSATFAAKSEINITANAPEGGTYTVKVDNQDAITITEAKTIPAYEGAIITMTSEADDTHKLQSTPFEVKDADGEPVSVSKDGDNYSFTMPNKAVTVTAKYSATYSITAAECTNGSITKITDKDGNVITRTSSGSKVIIKLSANEHYHIKSVYYIKENEEEHIDIAEKEGVYSFNMVAKNVTVYAEFEEDTKYIVTFNNNGSESSTKQVYAGDPIGTLPTLNSIDACDPHSKTFVGWTSAEAWEGKVASFDNFVTSETKVNAAMTLNAVWAESVVTPSTNYAKITSMADITDNDYVFAYDYNGGTQIAMKNVAIGSGHLDAAALSLTGGKYANPDAAYIWHIRKVGNNNYTFYNAAINKYVLDGVSGLELSTTPYEFIGSWDNTYNCFRFISSAFQGNYYLCGYVSGSTYYFQTTESGGDNKYHVHLYKNETQQSTTNYLTTCSSDPLIEVSTENLSNFSTIATAGPSAAQSFTVEGYNLTENITVSAATTGYEVSTTEAGSYASSLTLTATNGIVNKTTVYVRLAAADAAAASVAGNISLTSAGATEKNVALSGTVVAKTLNSISVATDPKTKYTLGETFDPTGLEITATYNSGDETVTYTGNEDKFTFSPDLGTALTAENTQETITYGGQTTTVDLSYQCSVAWKVNGSDWTEGVTTVVDYNKAVAAPTTAPTKSDCDDEKVFVGWTAATEITGEPADLFTTESAPLTANTTFYAVFANASSEGAVAVNTVLWGENFAHFGTNTPSAAGTGTGTTIYGDASIGYDQNDTGTKGYNEKYAGGTAPELLLKSGKTWTISNIKSGAAKEISLTFLANKTTFGLTCSSDAYTVSGSQKSWKLTLGEGKTVPETFNLTLQNTGSDNARIDNVELKITEAGITYSDYVTQCTPVYNVNFYKDEAKSELHVTQKIKGNEKPTAPTNPSKVGCNFLGWTETWNGEVVDVTSFTITADKDFFAKWEYITPSFSVHPENNAYIQNGGAAAMTVEATAGDATLSYQWQVSTTSSTEGFEDIAEATTTSYTPSTAVVGNFYYRCQATNGDKVAYSNVATIAVNPITQCYTPTITIGDGSYFIHSATVTLATQTEGATIYYTTDGTTASTTSTQYTDPFEISATTTVRAIAIKTNMTNSFEGSATFTKAALQSIEVETAPTKVAYNALENFAPAGLVITANYENNLSEDVAYADHESDFTFEPDLTAQLHEANTSVQITWNGKSANQTITVTRVLTSISNAATTATFYEGGQVKASDFTCTYNYNDGDPVADQTIEQVSLNGTDFAATVDIPLGQTGEKTITVKKGNLTTTVNITVNEKAKHMFVDRVNGNATQTFMDSYTIPTGLTVQTACEFAPNNNIFKGWVDSDFESDVITDADLLSVSSQTATANKTYYAVWAEHKVEDVKKTISKGDKVNANFTSDDLNGNLDENIQYNTEKGSGTTAPAVYSSGIRLYKPSSGNSTGGKITFKNRTGKNATITAFSIMSTGASSVNYEAGSLSGSLSSDNNTPYIVEKDGLSSSSVTVLNTKNDAWNIKYFEVTYTISVESDANYISDCVAMYELTFDANGGTGTAPKTILLKEGGKVALPNATLTKAYNYFNGWNTQADGQGTHYDVATEYTMGATATTLYADWAPRAVESLEITTPATTLEFGIGQTFSSEGLKVKANYIGGETETDVDFTTNFDNHVFTAADEGQKTVKVSYKGFDADLYQITVAPALIVRFFVNGTQIQEKAVFDQKIGAMPNAMTSDAWTNPENEFIASHYPVFAGWTLATDDENIEFVNEGTSITTDVNVNAAFAYSATPDLENKTLATSIDPSKRYVIVDGEKYYSGKAESNWAEESAEYAEVITFYGKSAPYAIQQTDGKYFGVPSNHEFYLKDEPAYNFQMASVATLGELLQVTNTNEYLKYNSAGHGGLRWYGSGTGSATYLYSVEVTYDHLTIAPKGDHVRSGLTYDKAGTICLPYAVKADDYKGASVWSIESRVGSGDMIYAITLVKEEDNEGNKKDLVAGKPYIFFAEESEFQLFYSGDEYTGSTSVWANGLIGNLNTEDIVINAGGYQPGSYLINQNKLMECGADCYVGQYRAYVQANLIGAGEPLQAPVMAPRRVIGNPNVAPTRIDNLNEDAWVNMNGAHKFFLDGNIVIMNEGKLYNAQGIRVQ